MSLSAEAEARFRAFETRLEPRLAEHGDLGYGADWVGKLAGASARIAGLLHAAEHAAGKAPRDVPIAGENMAGAGEIGIETGVLVPHRLIAFESIGADT
ncbi:MAG: DUF3987 domain-containing protein, partial [Thermomicrobiales bacterium]